MRRRVSTMPGFFVVHETEYAGELIEAEVAGSSFPFAVFVFGVPVSQENISVPGREVGFANRASKLRVRWRLRDFQVRDRIQAVHQRPPCGTKKQSSTPVDLLMNSTGVRSGVSSSLMTSGGMGFCSPSLRDFH